MFRNYVYYRAHTAEKPKLALEARKVAWKDRAFGAAASTVSSLWSATKAAIVTSTLVGIGGVTAAAGATFANYQTNLIPSNIANPAASVFCDFAPADNIGCSEENSLGYGWMLLKGSIGAGALAGVYSVGSDIWDAIANRKAATLRPIFETELDADVCDLVSATYNLQKTGGFFQNILLYGPPGTGKTMLAKWIAENSNMNYILTKASDLVNLIKTGDQSGELEKLFKSARQMRSPTILFIDEADAFCRDRTKVSAELSALLGDFLKEIEEPSDKVMLILATNKMEEFDSAVMNRIDHKLHIALPEADEREKILDRTLRQFFSEKEMAEVFNPTDLKEMNCKTEGLSGRALFKLANHLSGVKAGSGVDLNANLRDAAIKRFLNREQEAIALKTQALKA